MPQPAAFTPDPSVEILDAVTAIVSRAGAAILAVDTARLGTTYKSDSSPVTQADMASNAIIMRELARLLPDAPIVSEEAANRGAPSLSHAAFSLVDPLDGTVEFIAGRNEFTVNVALVRDGVPVLGVVGAPALGVIWRGCRGCGAERLQLEPGRMPHEAGERTTIRTRPWPPEGLTAAISRSHLDGATTAFLDRLTIAQRLPCGSALKFCRIAEGLADVYPRLSPTKEWDIAAGHAVLVAAGGTVETPSGEALTYGHSARDFEVPAFVAWGDARAHGRVP